MDVLAPSSRLEKTTARERGDNVEGERRGDVKGREYDMGDNFIGEGEGFCGRERDFARAGDGAVDAAEEIFTIRCPRRARICPRATPLNSKLGNIASVFEELLENDFCDFAKFTKIAISFEELLEMLSAETL